MDMDWDQDFISDLFDQMKLDHSINSAAFPCL